MAFFSATNTFAKNAKVVQIKGMQIVILPGLDGSSLLRQGLVSKLSPSWRTSVISYPNHVASYEELTEFVAPRLPSDDYILVAESYSGPGALKLAQSAAPNLKALILLTSFSKSPLRIPHQVAQLLFLLPWKSRLLLRIARPLLFSQWGSPEVHKAFEELVKNIPSTTIVNRLSAVLKLGRKSVAENLSLPTMLIIANSDRLVGQTISHDFQGRDVTLKFLQGPHFLAQTKPRAVAQQITEFAHKISTETNCKPNSKC